MIQTKRQKQTNTVRKRLLYITVTSLLSVVCSRTREDTVRQIVAGLTGDAEGCTDLASELSRGDPVTLEMQDSDEEGNDPEDWTPDPTDTVPGQTTQEVLFLLPVGF